MVGQFYFFFEYYIYYHDVSKNCTDTQNIFYMNIISN